MRARDRLAVALLGLCEEFAGWSIHRISSGRWLAVRGSTCLRAESASGLRDRLRRHLAEVADDGADEVTRADPIDLDPLARRLELQAEFPGWLIAREASGRWSARLPGWGVLYGQNCPELRERLRRHLGGAAGEC